MLYKVEEWVDWTAFVLTLVASVRHAHCGNFAAMAGWSCAAVWVVVAMVRRRARDLSDEMCEYIIERLGLKDRQTATDGVEDRGDLCHED